jgi:glycosyltransferase involved in cell wall biosynthesis
MKRVLISIIVPTKNEAGNLYSCLNSIINSDLNRQIYEIIVVDNFSTDQTIKIAKRYTRKVYLYGSERSAQRNFGARKARGKYLLFLDADMSIPRNLLSECLKCISTSYCLLFTVYSPIALYIPEVIIGDSYWNQVRRFERYFYNGTYVDAVRFIKKEAFLKTDGYDEKLTACEDWDLDLRLKNQGQFELISTPLFHNEQAFSLTKFLQKKSTYLRDNYQYYISKWPGRSEILDQFSLLSRLRFFFSTSQNRQLLFTNPGLTSGIFFLKLLLGIKYFIDIKIRI